MIGADVIYTDKPTVTSVQQKLKALAAATGNLSFDPGVVDGKAGPRTNAAVSAFNTAYGWPSDGSTITAGTLEAFKRPDVVDPKGYAASQAADVPPTAMPVAAATAAIPAMTQPMPSAFSPASVFPSLRTPQAGAPMTMPMAPSGGMPTWGWVLIGLGVVGGAAFLLTRRGSPYKASR